MTNLPPNGPEAPVRTYDLVQIDPCSALNELQAAYYNIITGGRRVHVRYKERETTYGKPDLPLLQAEIAKLTAMCRPGSFRAMTAWKPRVLGTFPMTARRYL